MKVDLIILGTVALVCVLAYWDMVRVERKWRREFEAKYGERP